MRDEKYLKTLLAEKVHAETPWKRHGATDGNTWKSQLDEKAREDIR